MQYMIILFILFLVPFALACAGLALSSQQQRHILRLGWSRASNELPKFQMQMHFSCCGFDNSTMNLAADDPGNIGHPPCKEVVFRKKYVLIVKKAVFDAHWFVIHSVSAMLYIWWALRAMYLNQMITHFCLLCLILQLQLALFRFYRLVLWL